MYKKGYYFVLIILSFMFTEISAQVYNGDLLIQTQTDIDNFNYTHVTGTLRIEGEGILNLDGLSELVSTGGSFILNNCDNVTSLNGLSNFTSSYGSFVIHNNGGITNLDPLSKLDSVGEEVEVGGLSITDNDALINIDGISNLIFIGYNLDISNNAVLTNLDALINIKNIGGYCTIDNNPMLMNIKGLSNMNVAYDYAINRNSSLKNLDGLNQPGGNIAIISNDSLTDISAFENFISGVSYLSIRDNASLSEFCPLYRIANKGGLIEIQGNKANPTISEIISNGPCTDTRSFISVLLGKNVTKPVITFGSGGGMFILNAGEDTLQYWIRVCELKCTYEGIHFHNGAPGITGRVVKDISDNIIVYPGSLDAYVHGIWTSTDEQPLTPVLVNELLNGNIYVDVHTHGYPSGEIRGQITSDKPAYLYANIDGIQAVPPVNTPGSGEGSFVLSGNGKSLEYKIKTYNLTGQVSTAAFVSGETGKAGIPVKDVIFNSDSSSGTWYFNDSQPLSPQYVADLLGCFMHLNITTAAHPSGEVRGRINKTDEEFTDYMTLWAVHNDSNSENYSRLLFYSLAEGKTFANEEGDITGYDGQKNIVDMTVDIGGNVFLLNNSWTSMIYKIKPEQFDRKPDTHLRAYQVGRTRTYPEDVYVWLTNISFINGKLYGFDNRTNKFYDINPLNAHVTELTELTSMESKSAGFVHAADGSVYLLKSINNNRSELWKFSNFPSPEIELVTAIPSLGKLKTLSSHPNGNLYATCSSYLYEINLKEKTIGVLKDHNLNVSAIGFDFFREKNTNPSATLSFSSFTDVTDVSDFSEKPLRYNLSRNYPNPFNPSTTIKYSLPEATFVKLVIYNSLGEQVRTIIDDYREAGEYEIVFNAADLPSGIYIAEIRAGSFISSSKMMLLK